MQLSGFLDHYMQLSGVMLIIGEHLSESRNSSIDGEELIKVHTCSLVTKSCGQVCRPDNCRRKNFCFTVPVKTEKREICQL